jgi:hypothetical protein
MPLAAGSVTEEYAMDHCYICEQCGAGATLCVSDWGYIAAFCDDCLNDRRNYMKLPGAEREVAVQLSTPAPLQS